MAEEYTAVLRDGDRLTVGPVTVATPWVDTGRGTKEYGLAARSDDGKFLLYEAKRGGRDGKAKDIG